MNEQWLVSMKKADFNAIAEKFGISPITARLLRNRGLIDEREIDKYLNGTLDALYSPTLMKDMSKACDILSKKISEKKHIRIIGDYDVDGVMSTYILLTGLRRLGAVVDERIPERIKDGYGLNEALVRSAYNDGADTILTCDNGISAYEQIKLAKELGLTVIVTDHHEIPFDTETGEQIIPPADAVVDSKQNTCDYPFKGLCGAVVAWKLISLLYERNGIPKAESDDFLLFAAIATICDVCDLTDENRLIVKYGLTSAAFCTNFGLNALMSLSGIDPTTLSVYHVGFVIGPCLNAGGRLDTAQRALSLLLSKSDEEALSLASKLVAMNQSRKEMTEEFANKACELIENSSLTDDKVLVVYLPDCHESLAGIIAGRIREKYNKPSFVLTASEGGVKGSGRSIDEYNMYESLNECKEYLTQFGGHAKAAGLSLKEENIDNLRNELNKKCSLTDNDLAKKLHIDMQLPVKYVSEKLIKEFDSLMPFGQGNPKPLFVQKNLKVINPSVVGKNRNVARMTISDDNGTHISAVYFGNADEFVDYVSHTDEISAVFYPTINVFRGVSSVQLVISHYR